MVYQFVLKLFGFKQQGWGYGA